MVDVEPNDLVVLRYRGCLTYRHIGNSILPHWGRVLDEMTTFT